MKKRLDQLLVDFGLAPSKTKAEELIESGAVSIRLNGLWKKQTKAGAKYSLEKEDIQLTSMELLKYVSRGGLKLEAALSHLVLEVGGFTCLDLGISTGGFADCLLRHGAESVTGVDVGKDELHPTLKDHPRIKALLGVNVRDLRSYPEVAETAFDLVTADLSFVSLDKIIPVIGGFNRPAKRWLLMVKPQFEVGRENLNKKGIVKEDAPIDELQKRISDLVSSQGYVVKDFFPVPFTGRDGNQEYFVYAESSGSGIS